MPKPKKKPAKKAKASSSTAASAPARKTRVFDLPTALSRAEDTASRVTPEVRARIERRLPAGTLERLTLATNTLREKETAPASPSSHKRARPPARTTSAKRRSPSSKASVTPRA